jgi:hypothetical protein
VPTVNSNRRTFTSKRSGLVELKRTPIRSKTKVFIAISSKSFFENLWGSGFAQNGYVSIPCALFRNRKKPAAFTATGF